MRIKTFTLSIFSIVIALTVLLIYSKGLANTEVRGFIEQDTRWTLDKSPYVAIGRLVVNEGITLTIEPGVTVKFKPDTGLRADGTLVARGTQEMPITFTTFEEKEPGSWGSISFASTSTPTELDGAGNYIQGSILEYTIIEYAGGGDNINAAVEVNASNILVDYCTISHSVGRGIYVATNGTVTITNNKISSGIDVNMGDATISNNTITGNILSFDNGGGIYIATNGTVTITNNNITGNTTRSMVGNGGGICVYYGTATISNNNITRNYADKGGGIYVVDGTVTITNNTITKNNADSGGGIYVYHGTVTINNNNITENTAAKASSYDDGGGIYFSGGNIQDFSSNTVIGNAARSTIFISSVPNQFKNNSIYNNETKFDIYYGVEKGTDMDATGNYWGTTDEVEISARIYDNLFDASKGLVKFVPFLTVSPCGPQAPTGLTLKILDASSVQLTWNANPEPDVTGYKLYYDTDSGKPYGGKGAKKGDSPIDVNKVTSYTLSGLQTDATYYFVITAYATGKESIFSEEVRSNHPPKTPSNLVPPDAMTNISLMPTLEGSAFSDPDAGDSHKASQWQITIIAGDYANPIYDSGVNTTNKTKITTQAGKLALNTTYYWRVRYQDNRGNWSDYSKESRFTTISEFPLTPPGIYQSKLSLIKGINIISLSLKPETPWTAKTIAQELGATIVIRAVDSKFEAYVAEGGIGEDFPIEANKGYIVNVTEPVNYTLLGTTWGEPVAAPSIEKENPTWAFVVTGVIKRKQSFRTPNIARITNLRTGESTTEKINRNGRFIAGFLDLNRHSVVQVDDAIELSFIDRRGNLLSKVIRRIQPEQVERAYLNTLIEFRPAETALFQNYPNPFNPETWIPYQIAQDAPVKIEIFNIAGKLIRRIELGNQAAGWYVTKDKAAYWDGCNETGEVVSSGIYFYKLRAGSYSALRKLLLVK